MAKISVATERALCTLALRLVVEHLDKACPGASGFAKNFAHGQTRADREINAAFDAHVKRIHRNLTAALKQDLESASAEACASTLAESNG